MKFSKKILEKAKKIKVLLSDVDGVLTKGELILLDDGEEVKVWDIKDRLAYTLIRKSGLEIKLGWISGRGCKQLEDRAKELKLTYFYQNVKDKLVVYNEILKLSKCLPEEIAYIGDDWLDIPVLKRVGLSVCPKDAVEEVKKYVNFISSYNSGCGVFREVVELILKAQNKWDYVFSIYNK
jgi:3-deoxy-D-manno-octulosonate 8-phosphate phosphatase (KDO 8-P phosphatase)